MVGYINNANTIGQKRKNNINVRKGNSVLKLGSPASPMNKIHSVEISPYATSHFMYTWKKFHRRTNEISNSKFHDPPWDPMRPFLLYPIIEYDALKKVVVNILKSIFNPQFFIYFIEF